MSDTAISVQNIGKAYRIWESPALRLVSPLLDSTGQALGGLQPGPWLRKEAARSYRDFWALRDVSFEVRRGESVGIVGRNGSGKSTLLQIIAGTMQPTSGTVNVRGRVAALLELGAGFNPEFTGRENVHLNGAVLGLSRAEVERRFDAIAAFADIGEFIDQPVKTYSSGMVVRLAFAVQIQVEPDVLIVDEALAVGDEPFQRKCFAQIAQLQERGATILFVSHSAAMVVELCRRAVLLDRGEQLITGKPKAVIQAYHRLCYSQPDVVPQVRAEIIAQGRADETPAATPQSTSWRAEPADAEIQSYYLESMVPDSRREFPSQGAMIEEMQILDKNQHPANMLVKGSEYVLRWRVRFGDEARRVRFGWTVKTISGNVISGAATHPEGDGFPAIPAGRTVEVRFNFRCLFNQGTYFLDAAVRSELPQPEMVNHGIVDALMFKVQPTPRTHRNGYVDVCGDPAWSVEEIRPAG